MASSNPGKLSLEAWWSLDEESGTRVDSHGANDLADNATVLYAAGKVGNAADFELDTTEFLDIADNASLSFDGNVTLTVGLWVYLETSGAEASLMSKYDKGTTDREYELRYNFSTDRWEFRVSDNGDTGANETGVDAASYGAVSNGVWCFILGWHDPDTDLIYIQVNNGTADSAAHSTGINTGASRFILGARDSTASEVAHLDGLIDEAFVYRRILTADQRTWLYNSGNGRAYNELLGSGSPVVMTPLLYI